MSEKKSKSVFNHTLRSNKEGLSDALFIGLIAHFSSL